MYLGSGWKQIVDIIIPIDYPNFKYLGGEMAKGQKRSYNLDPVVMKIRRQKKVLRDLEKLKRDGDKIVKEVFELGLIRRGRAGRKT